MSIATLKRKTQAQYNNSSVGHPQFSLNGTRRSAGYVGQDMLGRSMVRSLSKNGALRGHGGCCGKYPTSQIVTSPEMACLNDPSVVKMSSLDTNGLIMTKYRWIRRPYPYSSTKSNSYLNLNVQSTYIENLARKAIIDGSNCHVVGENVSKSCNSTMKNYNANINSSKCTNIAKPDSYTGALDSSEHIRTIDGKCIASDDFKIPNNTHGTPFGKGSVDQFTGFN
jgi:hypothetical protein